MKYIGIGETAFKIGVSEQTLRNWESRGFFVPHHKSSGGTRYYTQEQVNAYLGLSYDQRNVNNDCKTVIGYCRVSSHKQKDDLERQVENVKTYMIAKGYSFSIITDIGSGMNYTKKGLNELIDLVIDNKVDKIVVLYKDRLLRFGFELLDKLFSRYGVSIEVIDNNRKTDEQELTEDLVQILTVFSCKMQGKRAHRTKKMIEEVIEESSNEH